MEKFITFVNKKHQLSLKDYSDLYQYSIKEYQFWADVAEYAGLTLDYTEIVSAGSMDSIPKWFTGAKINYAQKCLERSDDQVAIYGTGEDGRLETITFAELRLQVGRAIQGFKALGLKKGDRVAAYIPNCKEAVVLYLACAALGLVWSSASPDFGTLGVLDRFQQIQPRVLLSVNAVVYNGKTYDHMGKVAAVLEKLTVEKVVIIPFVKQEFVLPTHGIAYSDFLKESKLEFEPVSFDHPMAILYSSGTTGKPKCIVHSQGGLLLQHLKEHLLHGGLGKQDVFFYYSTTGWMMWNWLVSGLLVGSTIVCYDGSPFQPNANHLWELVEKLKITAFGTSAKFIATMFEAKQKVENNLDSIHTIYSTGSPLSAELFDYIYTLKKDVLIGSITGGTDICSLFCGHNRLLPVTRGKIQCVCLGMKVEAWLDQDKPVYDEPGDLVCTRPFPAMPVYFWNDADGSKYHSAYFDNYKGVWYHGDFVIIHKDGQVVMLGRSDGTLKPGGVRFGSAELYNVMTEFPQVKDSLVVGQKYNNDERVVMFCKMVPPHTLEEILPQIKSRIRTLLSPRHVPAIILPIDDIPYTLTGKKVEIAVKRILNGEKVEPSSSLANPESLKLYYNLPL